MIRRVMVAACLLVGLTTAFAQASAPAGGPKKVLRYAFPIAETGFDPAQIVDLYSRTVTAHIFEGLYQYDPLAWPAKIRPLTADGMPEHSADWRTWTIRLQRGITFADDPAFKGQKRELVAEDYVYAIKRFADPKVHSAAWSYFEGLGWIGLGELRQRALAGKLPFDYDTPIEGLRAVDRYTLQFKMAAPQPRFLTELSGSDLLGAVAREVVEAYGDEIVAHPVGTGPFKLTQWRRGSLIVLERNPDFRDLRYAAQPATDDADGQAILARLKGRRLPMIDRVEVAIVAEGQPRWLTFLNDGSDLIEDVPPDFVGQAMPGGRLAPHLARRGMKGYRTTRSDVTLTFYNMDDPIVGGYRPEQVALRRAINLGVDLQREIRLVYRGQAIAAQSPVMPGTSHYAPGFKSENSEYSPAKAKALLEMHGYVDRDGDGWRERPDGSALLLRKATQTDQLSRQRDDEWRRNMTAIGVRIRFEPAQWPQNLQGARAGKLMMWSVGNSAGGPDSLDVFQCYDGSQIGGQNSARFNLPAFNAIYESMSRLPDGPQRDALFDQAKRLAVAYAPYKAHVHSILTDLTQARLIGYRRPLFWMDFWQYVDIERP